MDIALYQNNSDYRCVNKDLSGEKILEDVYLLESTDIVTPSFIVLRSDDTIFSVFNYVSVPAFNRFYFIKGIKVLDSERVQIDCEVDVLMSFKNDILEAEIVPITMSNIQFHNKFIVDSRVKNSCVGKTIIRKFSDYEMLEEVTPLNYTTILTVLR